MNDTLKLIAGQLADKNAIIEFKPNSVFSALELPGASDADYGLISGKIAQKLSGEVNLLKNKILPLMKELSKLINQKVSETRPTGLAEDYKIVEIDGHQIYADLKDAKLLAPSRPYSELPIAGFGIPTPEAGDIRKMFLHKMDSVNQMMAPTLLKFSDKDLQSLWDIYFGNVSKSNTSIENLFYNAVENFDKIALIYIAIINLRAERPEKVSAPESVYLNNMKQYEEEILNAISKAGELHAFHKKSGRLILSIQGKTINVVGDVYDEYLEEGGSQSEILGLTLASRIDGTVMFFKDHIKANAEAYTLNWDKAIKLERAAAVSKDVERYKTIYSIVTGLVYDELLPNDLADLANPKDQAQAMISELTVGKPASEILDIKMMSREIIAHVVFPQTNFHLFTDYMMEYSKLDETLKPNEAASLATFNIIMDYLLEQVDLVEHSTSSFVN